MREFTFKLTEAQSNQLINIIAEKPLKEVIELFSTIQSQVQEQMKPQLLKDNQKA